MSVLAAILVFLLTAIYVSGYREVYLEDQDMLEQYCALYAESGNPSTGEEELPPESQAEDASELPDFVEERLEHELPEESAADRSGSVEGESTEEPEEGLSEDAAADQPLLTEGESTEEPEEGLLEDAAADQPLSAEGESTEEPEEGLSEESAADQPLSVEGKSTEEPEEGLLEDAAADQPLSAEGESIGEPEEELPEDAADLPLSTDEEPPEEPTDEERVYALSTFYAVEFSSEGEVLSVDVSTGELYTEDEIVEIASSLLTANRTQGTLSNLVYRVQELDDSTLVAFMDNTIAKESITSLFRYTLLFGLIALVLIFILANYLSRRILQPIEESYRKQKQFLSDAGHELKTPVAVVETNAELLSREIGENPWLSNIQHENTRMAGLIRQMLDLARTESVEEPTERLDFSRIVVGEVLPFESIAFERGILIEAEQIEENIFVNGNSDRLGRLTAILLDNALDHAPSGSFVHITLTARRGKAVLSVTNEGEEIPKEEREKIFERFYRADASRTSQMNPSNSGSVQEETADGSEEAPANNCGPIDSGFPGSEEYRGPKKRELVGTGEVPAEPLTWEEGEPFGTEKVPNDQYEPKTGELPDTGEAQELEICGQSAAPSDKAAFCQNGSESAGSGTRTDQSRDENHYGLGLAIAKAIVTSCRGEIQILCADGLVTFQVTLPTVR